MHLPIIVKVFPDPVWPLTTTTTKKKGQTKLYSGLEFFINHLLRRTHTLK